MRNTFFSALLLFGVNTVTHAQQTTTVSGTLRGVGAFNQAAQVAAMAAQNEYYYSDHQINDADLKSKEVSKEITTPKNGDIYIENFSRSIIVRTWDQQKVKVTTTVYYEGDSKLTDDEWFDKTNLSLKTLGNSVKIKSGGVTGSNFYSFGNGSNAVTIGSGNGVAVFNGSGQNIGTKSSNVKRILTITVPAGSKLDIESKYSDVTLPDNINDVKVDISNGNLEAGNLTKFILRSKYSNINVGDVKSAEVEFANGRFSAKTIDDLDIESKYSTIEMAAVKKMVIRSTNDEYELEEAGEVRGRKSYGNLRITKLDGSLEVEGTNADVKIRKVGPSLSLIKLDDKYADIRIPLRDTKSYSIDFAGNYSSVYGNFEKKPVVTEKDKKDKTTPSSSANTVVTDTVMAGRLTTAGTVASNNTNVFVPGGFTQARTLYLASRGEDNGPSRFTAIVGDGKGLKVDIKCQNCTVDFK